jgi:hypothetical protein
MPLFVFSKLLLGIFMLADWLIYFISTSEARQTPFCFFPPSCLMLSYLYSASINTTTAVPHNYIGE